MFTFSHTFYLTPVEWLLTLPRVWSVCVVVGSVCSWCCHHLGRGIDCTRPSWPSPKSVSARIVWRKPLSTGSEETCPTISTSCYSTCEYSLYYFEPRNTCISFESVASACNNVLYLFSPVFQIAVSMTSCNTL